MALSHLGYQLDSNAYGVGGRKTSLQECLFEDTSSGTFGWNWTRGHTDPECVTKCKAPNCFADFSFASLAYGISPWGKSTGSTALPVSMDAVKSLVVTQNVSWQWSDDAPGVDPPSTSASDERRVRFIYDMFLTSVKPNGTNIQVAITDELIITLASNPGFPGSQPPGCLHPGSRFANKTWGPVKPNAVWDGYYWYDYYWTDHNDAVPGTGTRYSSFRRKSAETIGEPIPQKVNIKPFIQAIRDMWPGEQVGPWLGHVAIGTELYDHSRGKVTFHGTPDFDPIDIDQSASQLLV